MNNRQITSHELRATWGLGLVLFLRMLGMFMILPVITTYGSLLLGASETLIGLSISIYGLMQATFQIPFGLLSDHIGRKPLIISGLLISIIGSIIAALSHSIWGVIIGRALQGSGAISSVTMALLLDLINEQNRTKVMSFIGVIFGITFAIAMVLGPMIARSMGLHILFWIIAILSTMSIFLVLYIVPNGKRYTLSQDSRIVKSYFRKILFEPRLLKINFSIMCLHILLMSTFIAIPKQLESSGSSIGEHWKIYLVSMIISLFFMIPLTMYAEIKQKIKRIVLLSIALLFVSAVLFFIANVHYWTIVSGIQVFFLAFNIMEALLPSLISKESPAGYKGTVMGIYSTSQFIGVAIGGSVGGWIQDIFGSQTIFTIEAFLTIIWFLIAFTIKEPPYVSSFCIKIPKHIKINEELKIRFEKTAGVREVLIVPEERHMYIKIDNKIINHLKIEQLLKV